jgi:hypothetical protein
MNLYRAPPSNTAVMKEAMKLAKNKGKLITFSNLSNYNEKYDPKGLKVYSDGMNLKKYHKKHIMQFF